MAQRARLLGAAELMSDGPRVVAPTLVVTGERQLDRVVPASGSHEYLRLIRGARAAQIDRTGHLGCITRPDAFVTIVDDFVRTTDVAFERRLSRSNGDPHAA
jgi:pimeloyl-ACP methyl ester carboxylesterase